MGMMIMLVLDSYYVGDGVFAAMQDFQNIKH